MYLQTGDECMWLEQKRHSLEAEANDRLGTPSPSADRESRAAMAIAGTAFDRAAGMAASLVERLLRSRLAGALGAARTASRSG